MQIETGTPVQRWGGAGGASRKQPRTQHPMVHRRGCVQRAEAPAVARVDVGAALQEQPCASLVIRETEPEQRRVAGRITRVDLRTARKQKPDDLGVIGSVEWSEL